MYSDYEKQARDFLKSCGASISISLVDTVTGFPFDDRDHQQHNKYRITLKRAGKTYSFPFYDSAYNTSRGARPGAYDVLASLEKDCYASDVWGFADEYGYSIDCKKEFDKVTRIYKACKKQARRVQELFGDVLDDLYEIQ